MEHVHAHFIEGTHDAAAVHVPTTLAPAYNEAIAEGVEAIKKNFSLTDIFPDPGYFAAGAVAGIVSRTSTAPLDRLKVYLIASVGNAKGSIDAAKKGDAVAAVRHLGQPLIDASKDIWRNGGVRNLFAGKNPPSHVPSLSTDYYRQWSQCYEGHARIRHQIRFLRSCQESLCTCRRP